MYIGHTNSDFKVFWSTRLTLGHCFLLNLASTRDTMKYSKSLLLFICASALSVSATPVQPRQDLPPDYTTGVPGPTASYSTAEPTLTDTDIPPPPPHWPPQPWPFGYVIFSCGSKLWPIIGSDTNRYIGMRKQSNGMSLGIESLSRRYTINRIMDHPCQ